MGFEENLGTIFTQTEMWTVNDRERWKKQLHYIYHSKYILRKYLNEALFCEQNLANWNIQTAWRRINCLKKNQFVLVEYSY